MQINADISEPSSKIPSVSWRWRFYIASFAVAYSARWHLQKRFYPIHQWHVVTLASTTFLVKTLSRFLASPLHCLTLWQNPFTPITGWIWSVESSMKPQDPGPQCNLETQIFSSTVPSSSNNCLEIENQKIQSEYIYVDIRNPLSVRMWRFFQCFKGVVKYQSKCNCSDHFLLSCTFCQCLEDFISVPWFFSLGSHWLNLLVRYCSSILDLVSWGDERFWMYKTQRPDQRKKWNYFSTHTLLNY